MSNHIIVPLLGNMAVRDTAILKFDNNAQNTYLFLVKLDTVQKAERGAASRRSVKSLFLMVTRSRKSNYLSFFHFPAQSWIWTQPLLSKEHRLKICRFHHQASMLGKFF